MNIAYGNQVYLTKHDFIIDSQNAVIPNPYPSIEIQISCRNLPKLDSDSEVNPMCIFYAHENGYYTEIGRTDLILNNTNPDFSQKFLIYYIFEINQPLKFEIYDCNARKSSLQKTFIGQCETDAFHLISATSPQLVFELQNAERFDRRGQLVITVHPVKTNQYHLQGQIQVNKLKKVKTFAKNNPFFVLSKKSEDDEKNIVIYRSEIVPQCYSCSFQTFSIPLNLLCTENLDVLIILSFYHCNKKGIAKRIGKYQGSIRQFKENVKSPFSLSKKTKTKGQFWFNFFNIIQIPTFSDYFKSRIQIKLMTAIDFSDNNEVPKSMTSLHQISDDQNSLNHYQKCIYSIGSVLAKYNKDGMFPVFGFGAKINDRLNHCFPLTLTSDSQCVNGHQGILDAYKKSIGEVTLSSPPYLSLVLEEAVALALRNYQNHGIYSVLLVLATSMICDMKRAIEIIGECSSKPISFIFIGIGDGDFTEMEKLNSVESQSNFKRDLVQFVKYNEIDDYKKLQRKVLARLPKHIHEFCASRGFVPSMNKNELFY